MSDFLTTMAKQSADRAAASKARFGAADFELPVVPLELAAFDVIAELKNRSPSEGELASETSSLTEQAQRYVAGGAAAISVLTEPTQFSGALTHLEDVVRVAGPVPVMRKDFMVDPVQVLEARAAGASGVLLIVTILKDSQLEELMAAAGDHTMFVLLECFDEEDLERAGALLGRRPHRDRAASNRILVGVNARDLRTLHVDPTRLEALAPLLPQDVPCVAESGLHDADDAARAAELGYRVALVGTALMRAEDPRRLIETMVAAGRARRA